MTDEEIVRTYSGMVYRIAYGYSRNEADRNDIFQDAFFTYFKKKRRFASEEHRKHWLIRVTINCSKDFVARRAKYVSFEDAPPDALSSVDTELEAVDLPDAISKLPDNRRNIIYMYYYEGMSIEEIADAIEMNPNTVKTHLLRGREQLKKALGEDIF